MRKLAFFLILLGIAALIVSFYPAVAEKPELNAQGPMGIVIDPVYPAPEYHSPVLYWKTHHMDLINQGVFAQQDCLYCHAPETSCNNCHTYVGAQAVVEE
jgi:hypothetical protein